jgi:DnaJ domain
VIRIYLILLLIVLAYFALRWFQKAAPATVARTIRILFYALISLALLYLGAIGHLNWLFALIGVVIAFAARMLPVLLRYAPYLHRLWLEFINAKQQSSRSQNERPDPKGGMTKQEAYDVLGLKPGASEHQIIDAHRKLMQKIHPDRGGSDYLAAKINLAKKTLIKK